MRQQPENDHQEEAEPISKAEKKESKPELDLSKSTNLKKSSSLGPSFQHFFSFPKS